MKNIKRLLEVMAVLGFSTGTAVNVVACCCSSSNSSSSSPPSPLPPGVPGETLSDLDKSFESSYIVPFRSMAAAGLVANLGKFNFTFGTSDSTGLKQTLITITLKTKADAPIKVTSIMKQQGATAPPFPVAAKDVVAAGVIGADQTDLTADTTNGVVKVTIKLVLWKSVAAGASFKWEKQSVTKDITLNIVTNTVALANIITTTNLDKLFIAGTTPTKAELLTAIKAVNTGAQTLTVAQFTIAYDPAMSLTTCKIIGDGTDYTGDVTLTYTQTKLLFEFIKVTSLGEIDFSGVAPSATQLLAAIKVNNPGLDALTTVMFTIKGIQSDIATTITGDNPYSGDVTLSYIKQPIDISTGVTITDTSTLNVNAPDLTRVTKTDLQASLDAAVQIAVQAKAGATTVAKDTDYTYDLFASNIGNAYVPLDLTSSKYVFVKITAMGNKLTAATDYLAVKLPVANDLGVITTTAKFGTLVASNFVDVIRPSAVRKNNIINAIKTKGVLLAVLKSINSNFSDVSQETEIQWKIGRTPTGEDIERYAVNASRPGGVTVYITLTPGTTKLATGTAQASACNGIAVHIPQLL